MKLYTKTGMLVMVGFYVIHTAFAWDIADGPLKTRWAKDVTPENAWREYPRPQMTREAWVNLNGLWDYSICPKEEEQPPQWDGKILVPFAVESALSGVMKAVRPDQRLWYRRAFPSPAMTESDRLLLHFGAVDWQCVVWLNGQRVGEHSGGYDPFTFDITDALQSGENELLVAVWDPTDAGFQPRGKQVREPKGIWYTAVTGIWQTVWLETVPANYIKSLKIVPDVDHSAVKITVNTPEQTSVDVSVLDGNEIVAQSKGRTAQSIEIKINSAKLWSPDSPYLYDLKISLIHDGQRVDTVHSYFGMRKIEVRKDEKGINRLFLNNQVLFQYGPLDQGWWPDGLYTAASDEALQYDIAMTKQFGMNMARKHVKYESARWYYWCDKLGLMIWQDMPSGDAGRNDESKANYRRELKAMIDALHPFPSIVMWVPFNEGWGQHDTGDVVAWIQEYDPTRPVNEASGWHDRKTSDVSDMHSYPGPGMRPVEEKRVSVLGEFGGLGMPVAGHTWQAEKNWGYVSYKTAAELTHAYVELLTQMRPLIGMGLSAAVYTQTSDVEIEVNGLMTYDREIVKMNLETIAAAAKKLYLPPPIVKALVPTSQSAAQTWRYTTNRPADDWFQSEFNDQSWQTGPGGFGTEGTPGAVVKTKWDTSDIWLRRTFDLVSIPSDGILSVSIHHDEDAKVYINGRPVKTFKGYVSSYRAIPLNKEALSALKVGQNTFAVHCRQTTGGQYIDVGLVMMVEKE